MYPLKATRKTITESAVSNLTAAVLQKILLKCKPRKIYLFGSAAVGKFTDQSDLDLLLVFDNDAEIKMAQKKLKGSYPLDKNIPVDLVWTSAARFDDLKDKGGVCFLALSEGRLLYAAENQ